VALRLWLWLGLGLVGCSGQYPLPPTRCDEWCDATKGGSCVEYYDPAGCVSSCEAARNSGLECAGEFDATIACYRRNPEAAALLCDFSFTNQPCQAEVFALGICTSPTVSTPSERID
jgi:hypothetical protein